MYSHPSLIQYQKRLMSYRMFVYLAKDLLPGTKVEHRNLPGVNLVIVSGPHKAVKGEQKYMVKMPDGMVVPVLKKNLII